MKSWASKFISNIIYLYILVPTGTNLFNIIVYNNNIISLYVYTYIYILIGVYTKLLGPLGTRALNLLTSLWNLVAQPFQKDGTNTVKSNIEHLEQKPLPKSNITLLKEKEHFMDKPRTILRKSGNRAPETESLEKTLVIHMTNSVAVVVSTPLGDLKIFRNNKHAQKLVFQTMSGSFNIRREKLK